MRRELSTPEQPEIQGLEHRDERERRVMVQIECRDSKKSAEKVVGHFDEDFVFEPESSGKLLTCFK